MHAVPPAADLSGAHATHGSWVPGPSRGPAHVSSLLRALERRGRALMAMARTMTEPATLRAALGSFEQGLGVDPSHAGLRAGHAQATRELQQRLHAGGDDARCPGGRHELRVSMRACARVQAPACPHQMCVPLRLP